jgi:predicted HAD superfamily Cof-like phosphohydrolase
MQANILCLHEEVLELTEAYDNADLAGAVDALVDLIYFAYGFLWQMGIPTRDVWDAVHEANMTKQLGNKGRGILDDAVKPEGWVDPKTVIRELLK